MSTKGKLSDLDKLDFLECYVRHGNNLHDVCTEYNLKYNTAAMRLKTIHDDAAKRRGVDPGTVVIQGKATKATGGKKAGGAAAGASGAANTGKKTATKRGGKKRKLEEAEGDDEEAEELEEKKKVVKKEKKEEAGEVEEDDD